MKKIYLFLISTTGLLVNSLSAQAPPEILHYNFNGTGSLVTNYASSPPTGTGIATITAGHTQGGTSGQCGSGAIIGSGNAATTDYLNTNWSMSFSGSWSISFWSSNIGTSATLYYIFGDNSAFRCFTNGVAGSGNWILRGTGFTDMLITGGATIAACHNVFVYDATLSKGSMYLNGVLQGTVAQTGTPAYSNAVPFKVAGWASNVGLPSLGTLDEFRFYARVLTPTEVTQLYNGAPVSTTVTVTSCGSYTSPVTSTVYPSSGVYTETYPAACGGTSTNNINLTVNALPNLTVTASIASICSGVTVNLTTTGNATTYTWNTTGPNTSSIAVIPAATSVYTVSGTNGGCTTTKTISINVTPTPTLGFITSGNPVCAGSSVNITASGATTYSWNTNATTNAITVAPASNTTYTVTGTTGTCVSTGTIVISVNITPTIAAAASSNTICDGTTATLTATGAPSFAWSTSATGSMITVSPSTNTTYIVIGISGTCSDSKTLNITVNPSPTVSVSSSTLTSCSGSVVTLTASGATSYSWNTSSNTNPTTASPLATTVYTVTGTSGGCSRNATLNITVLPGPTITVISSATAVCSGAPVSLAATGASNYTWSTNAFGNGITDNPTVTTTYTVYGKAPNNCLGVATPSILVNPNPAVAATSNNSVMCKGESAVITASGAGTYAWSNSTTSGNTVVVSPTLDKSYTVTGTDANGCSSTVVVFQKVNTCLGIGKIEGNIVSAIYPNPNKGLFNLVLNSVSDNTSVEIYNSSGQLVLLQKVNSNKTVLNIGEFSSGLYYLKVKNADTMELIKLLKE